MPKRKSAHGLDTDLLVELMQKVVRDELRKHVVQRVALGELSPFCVVHPVGTERPCVACGDARRSVANSRVSDGFRSIRADLDERDRCVRREPEGDVGFGAVANPEPFSDRPGSSDTFEGFCEAFGIPRMRPLVAQMEHGPVVVQLSCHCSAHPLGVVDNDHATSLKGAARG